MSNKNILDNSIYWRCILDYCDISDVMSIVYVNRSSNKGIGNTLLRIVEKVKKNNFINIPVRVANKLYSYFLTKKEYKYMFRVLPFTQEVVTYRVFVKLDLKYAIKLFHNIKHNPKILEKDLQNRVWFTPYKIAKETFGINLDVFKYAIDMCIVYGLSYMIIDKYIEESPSNPDEDDIVFLEYIKNNV